jgi:DNA-packaging protein gp3
VFKTPDDLWKAANEYFEWVQANPLSEEKVFCYQGNITKTKVTKMQAMTVAGLCMFLDITDTTWENYCKRQDFLAVTSRIKAAIRHQKFVGASADLLNANIIARDLGLADKTEHSGAISFVGLADRVKRAKERR